SEFRIPKSERRPNGKAPTLPEDSRSSTISGRVRGAMSNGKPIPLTLTCLPQEEQASPLPQGEGTADGPVRLFGRFVGQTPRSVVPRASGGFSLSPRERAGVRGSLRRPTGRMALSHLFFHASGFAAGIRILVLRL